MLWEINISIVENHFSNCLDVILCNFYFESNAVKQITSVACCAITSGTVNSANCQWK